jgi:hypothetical protein
MAHQPVTPILVGFPVNRVSLMGKALYVTDIYIIFEVYRVRPAVNFLIYGGVSVASQAAEVRTLVASRGQF